MMSLTRRILWAAVRVIPPAVVIGPIAGLALVASAHAAGADNGVSALPSPARASLSSAVGNAEASYRVHGWSAVNLAQRMRVGFSAHGVTVRSGQGRVRIAADGFGRAGALRPVGGVSPRVHDNLVAYAHGDLREWYANGPLGLEQGFLVGQRPPGGSGPLVVSLSLAGNLAARLERGTVIFARAGVVLRYGGLRVADACGRRLSSWLSLQGDRLSINVRDRGAVYPLRIDPFVQQGSKLVGTSASG